MMVMRFNIMMMMMTMMMMVMMMMVTVAKMMMILLMVAEPGLASEIGRYHPSVWGKLDRQSAGRKISIAPSRAAQKRCEFHSEHDFDGDARASPDEVEGWDLSDCRSLLVTLDENDLRR